MTSNKLFSDLPTQASGVLLPLCNTINIILKILLNKVFFSNSELYIAMSNHQQCIFPGDNLASLGFFPCQTFPEASVTR